MGKQGAFAGGLVSAFYAIAARRVQQKNSMHCGEGRRDTHTDSFGILNLWDCSQLTILTTSDQIALASDGTPLQTPNASTATLRWSSNYAIARPVGSFDGPCCMKIWKEVGIALAGVTLTIAFDFATVAFVDHERFEQIKADHNKLLDFLVVPFDLWLVAFAVIVGVALSSVPNDRNKVVPAAVALAISLVLIMCSFALSSIFPTVWLRICIPDLVGIALIGFTANQIVHRA